MNEPELKPCPFCGGKANIKGANKKGYALIIWCECNDCNARTSGYCPDLENEDTSIESIERCKIKAIEAWNRRVADE